MIVVGCPEDIEDTFVEGTRTFEVRRHRAALARFAGEHLAERGTSIEVQHHLAAALLTGAKNTLRRTRLATIQSDHALGGGRLRQRQALRR